MALAAVLTAAAGVLLTNPAMVSELWLGEKDAAALLALSIVFIAVALSPFVLGRRRGGSDWFEIIYVLSAAYVLNFALRGMYDVFMDSTLGVFEYHDTLVQAQLFSLVGFVCLLIGYYLPIARTLAQMFPIPDWCWSVSSGFGRVILLYSVGLGARLVLRLQNVSVEFEYYLSALSQLTSFALAIAVMYGIGALTGRLKWRLFAGAVLPLQLVYAFVWNPNKLALIEPVYLILVCSHYFRKRVRLWVLGLSVLAAAVVIFPVMARYRSEALGLKATTRLNLTFENLATEEQGTYGDLVLESVMRRSHLLDSVAVVIKYASVPDWTTGLRDYVLIPAYAFVPRVVWPNKPIDSAVSFGRNYLGLTGDTSIGISNPGELYANLGLVGIVLGMFSLGVLYRVCYASLMSDRQGTSLGTRLPRVFCYMFLLEQFYFTFESGVSSGLTELLKKAVLLGFVAFFMSGRKTQAEVGQGR